MDQIISIDDVKDAIVEFCSHYPSVSVLKFKVNNTQEENYGPNATQEAVGRIAGSFHPSRGTVAFAASNFRSQDELEETLKHEILGHFGVNTFRPNEKLALLESIVEAHTQPILADLWEQIDELYPELDEIEKAEEVYCFASEYIQSHQNLTTAAGERSFQECCLDKTRTLQIQDLFHITSMVAAGLRDQTRSQQTFPASDDASFKFHKDRNMDAKKPFHETVAENLIKQLEQGTAPWQKPWSPGEPSSMLPFNPTTGNRYKGINSIHLLSQGFHDQRWMTYDQAKAEGAQVRKGEKSTTIQYWKFNEQRPKKDADGKPVLDAEGKPQTVTVVLDRPKVFYASVFNAEQIDGLPPLQPRPQPAWSAVERAEQILKASGADIREENGNRAYYSVGRDAIVMPERAQFNDAAKFYATQLHELGHWTGHPSRLNRDLSNPFGSEGYAKEELRAEIASMIVGDELGIGHDPGQHAAYVKSWIKVLQDNPMEIFRAAADAEKIHGYVLGLEQTYLQKQEQENLLKQELVELHAQAIPTYSPLESWENLEAAAKAEGLTAKLRLTEGDEYAARFTIDYVDAKGRASGVHSEMFIEGKVLSFANGQRVPGTGPTTDPEWQTAALSRAIAIATGTLTADMERERRDAYLDGLEGAEKPADSLHDPETRAEYLKGLNHLEGFYKIAVVADDKRERALDDIRRLKVRVGVDDETVDPLQRHAYEAGIAGRNMLPDASASEPLLTAYLQGLDHRLGYLNVESLNLAKYGMGDASDEYSPDFVQEQQDALQNSMREIEDLKALATTALSPSPMTQLDQIAQDVYNPLTSWNDHREWLGERLRESTLTPGSYEPNAAAKSITHAAVFAGDTPMILCGPADDSESVAIAQGLAENPELARLMEVAGHYGALRTGSIEGKAIEWKDVESAVAAKPAGKIELGDETGPLMAIVLNDREHGIATALCTIGKLPTIIDPAAPDFTQDGSAGQVSVFDESRSARARSAFVGEQAIRTILDGDPAALPAGGRLLDRLVDNQVMPIEQAAFADAYRDLHLVSVAPDSDRRIFMEASQKAFGFVVPPDWNGLVRVQGEVTGINGRVTAAAETGAEPNTWGVYAQRDNGFFMQLKGFDSEAEATALADRLHLIHAYAATNEGDQAVRLAGIREMLVRRDPNSTDEDITAAIELRKDAEMAVMQSTKDKENQQSAAIAEQSEKNVPATTDLKVMSLDAEIVMRSLHGLGIPLDDAKHFALNASDNTFETVLDEINRLDSIANRLNDELPNYRVIEAHPEYLEQRDKVLGEFHNALEQREQNAQLTGESPRQTTLTVDNKSIDHIISFMDNAPDGSLQWTLSLSHGTEPVAELRDLKADELDAAIGAENAQRIVDQATAVASLSGAQIAPFDGHSPRPPANIATEKTWLAVPYPERETAKKIAGKLPNGVKAIDWDREAKCWFANPGADLDKLKKWLPDTQVQSGPSSLEKEQLIKDEFKQALTDMGLIVIGEPIMDGSKQRVPVEGGKRGASDGFYFAHLNEVPAGYIENHKLGESMKWKSKGYVLSESDKANMAANAAAKLEQRNAETLRAQEQAAQRVEQMLPTLTPVSAATPYMQTKGLDVHAGIYTDSSRQTFVPLSDGDGKIWSLQFIHEDGTKRFTKNGRKEGCFHVIGGDLDALATAPAIVVGEGYATMSSATTSLGFPTTAAFDSGNLESVVKELHSKYPDKPVLILGDDDRHVTLTQGRNPGREKAEAAAALVGGTAVFPVFAPGEGVYPADLPPVTPDAYRAHLSATKALEQSNLTAEQTQSLQEKLLDTAQLEALDRMKAFTDFNDLNKRSALGDDGLQRQLAAALALASEQARTQEQQQSLTRIPLQEQEQQKRRSARH